MDAKLTLGWPIQDNRAWGGRDDQAGHGPSRPVPGGGPTNGHRMGPHGATRHGRPPCPSGSEPEQPGGVSGNPDHQRPSPLEPHHGPCELQPSRPSTGRHSSGRHDGAHDRGDQLGGRNGRQGEQPHPDQSRTPRRRPHDPSSLADGPPFVTSASSCRVTAAGAVPGFVSANRPEFNRAIDRGPIPGAAVGRRGSPLFARAASGSVNRACTLVADDYLIGDPS